MPDNKVKFGLKNAHYAIATVAADGSVTYDTPVALPGAVNLSMAASGDRSTFYADNVAYWEGARNNGYEGTLELALVPDEFRQEVLGEYVDKKSVYAEDVNGESKYFALLFQFDGDKTETLHVIYKCLATRPDVASSTITETTEPVTETLNLSATPIYVEARNKWFVKARTSGKTDAATKAAWFESVYMPDATA